MNKYNNRNSKFLKQIQDQFNCLPFLLFIMLQYGQHSPVLLAQTGTPHKNQQFVITLIIKSIMPATSPTINNQQSKHSRNSEFIDKLLEMMKQYPLNVVWSQNGAQVCFYNIEAIKKQILPVYFRHSNMLSFVRQLNMYNFSKVECEDTTMMKFKHPIFIKDNQTNYHHIKRRNKSRDQVVLNLDKHYDEPLKLLQNENRLSKQTKDLIKLALEFHYVSLKNIKKIKANLEQISNSYKGARSTGVKSALKHLQETDLPMINHFYDQSKCLEMFVKKSFCRDLGQEPISSAHSMLNMEQKTMRDVEIVRGLNMHMHSDSNFMNFQSSCSLERNLREGVPSFPEAQDDISLGEDLKQTPIFEHM